MRACVIVDFFHKGFVGFFSLRRRRRISQEAVKGSDFKSEGTREHVVFPFDGCNFTLFSIRNCWNKFDDICSGGDCTESSGPPSVFTTSLSLCLRYLTGFSGGVSDRVPSVKQGLAEHSSLQDRQCGQEVTRLFGNIRQGNLGECGLFFVLVFAVSIARLINFQPGADKMPSR